MPHSAAAYDLRDFLQRSGHRYTWTELKSDEQARQYAGVSGLFDQRLPVCRLQKGTVLNNPSVHDLACALDWFKEPRLSTYDLAILGAGPAGLSAAVYGASEGLSVIVIERSAVGGQAASSSRIENYLGFPDGISGWDLASRARHQAQRLGAEIIVADEAVENEEDRLGVTWLASGTRIVSRATICATGVDYSRIGLAGEERFLNHGLYYGAGASEAALCSGRIFVVGAGNSAGQAALDFAAHNRQVTMLVRGRALSDTLSSYLAARVLESSMIEVQTESELIGLEGDTSLQRITYRDRTSGTVAEADTNYVFLCIGGAPRTSWAKRKAVYTDTAGYILTGNDLPLHELPLKYWADIQRVPLFLETSRPGMFAVGDVRHGSIKRCVTAVGDGATAISVIHQFLALK